MFFYERPNNNEQTTKPPALSSLSKMLLRVQGRMPAGEQGTPAMPARGQGSCVKVAWATWEAPADPGLYRHCFENNRGHAAKQMSRAGPASLQLCAARKEAQREA